MKRKFKELTSKLEKMGKKKFYPFCGLVFSVFLFLGLMVGYGIKAYRVYQLKKYQLKVEKEMTERLTSKLEKYQLKLI